VDPVSFGDSSFELVATGTLGFPEIPHKLCYCIHREFAWEIVFSDLTCSQNKSGMVKKFILPFIQIFPIRFMDDERNDLLSKKKKKIEQVLHKSSSHPFCLTLFSTHA